MNILQGIEDAIVSVRLATNTFPTVLVALHSVFSLVRAFCFSVKLAHSDQIECVCKELGLYFQIELAITGETWRKIYFDKPWFEIAVDHYVEAVHLEAVRAVDASFLIGIEHSVFSRKHTFDDYVENARPKQIHIDVDLL